MIEDGFKYSRGPKYSRGHCRRIIVGSVGIFWAIVAAILLRTGVLS